MTLSIWQRNDKSEEFRRPKSAYFAKFKSVNDYALHQQRKPSSTPRLKSDYFANFRTLNSQLLKEQRKSSPTPTPEANFSRDFKTSTKHVWEEPRRPLSPSSEKFWKRRYSLFSRFDEGIHLDDESWFSVTPEKLAEHHAKRLACDIVIVDGFCGAGGNSIQFAKICKRVIAIDMDPKKIELARHNAKIYGVAHKIEFIVGDFMKLAPKLTADVVFLSPPWGGPDYVRKDVYCLESMLLPVSIHELLKVARSVSSNVATFLPKNSRTEILFQRYNVEVEANYLGKWINAITVYCGELVRSRKTESHVPAL